MLTDLNASMEIMREEPFGPVALFFKGLDDAIAEANRPFGSRHTPSEFSELRTDSCDSIEAGTITINHLGVGLPEVIRGVKDSGYGSEEASKEWTPT